MSRLRKIGTAVSLPAGVPALFLQAVHISARMRFTMMFLSFNRVLQRLGTSQKESPVEISDAHRAYAEKVKSALWLCNKYTFWKTECYVQAITAKILLQKKGIPSTIYIGFRRDGEMKGHAWLRCGNLIVTGNKGHTAFQVHSFFS